LTKKYVGLTGGETDDEAERVEKETGRERKAEREREGGRKAELRDKHMILALSTKCAWKWPTQTWSCLIRLPRGINSFGDVAASRIRYQNQNDGIGSSSERAETHSLKLGGSIYTDIY
jgi:hypothetical protein